jgi:hypothetical protein
MSGQIHASVALPPWLATDIKKAGGLAGASVCMNILEQKNILPIPEIETRSLDHLALSLVNIPTELLHLLGQKICEFKSQISFSKIVSALML